jgi:arylformamidase
MKIYDITATIGDSLPVYDDKERFVITELMQIAKGDLFNVSRLTTTTHTGTHADMPLHFVADGAACDNIALDYFYGRAKVIRFKATGHISKTDLEPYDIEAGDIILLDTGQSPDMRQPALKEDFFALTPDAAHYLAEKKIKTLGIDYLSVDPYGTPDFPVHTVLLGNDIAILEGLVLDGVPEGDDCLRKSGGKIRLHPLVRIFP